MAEFFYLVAILQQFAKGAQSGYGFNLHANDVFVVIATLSLVSNDALVK